jgi:hypothetical protein
MRSRLVPASVALLVLAALLAVPPAAGAQAERSAGTPFQTTVVVNLTTQSEREIALDPVPAGKRLVVEYIGIFSHVGAGHQPLTLARLPNLQAIGLPLTLQASLAFAVPKDAYGGSFPTRILVDAGQSLAVFFGRYGGLSESFASFYLSGHLLDAP